MRGDFNVKKQVGKRFLVLGIIAALCGAYTLFVAKAGLFADLGLSDDVSLLLKVFGGVLLLFGCGLLAYFLMCGVARDKRYEVEEKDERNIAIRGKAAQAYQTVSSGVYLTLLVVFLILDFDIPALLLGVGALVASIALIFAFTYYFKKM
jgi:hypothetical protein